MDTEIDFPDPILVTKRRAVSLPNIAICRDVTSSGSSDAASPDDQDLARTVPRPTLNKLCILSTSSRNRVLQTIRNTDVDYLFDFCHYIASCGGMRELLCGISNKLMNFTRNDYCIIIVGEADFKHVQDYAALVIHVRNVLLDFTHTNIIISAPTYICGAGLYNSRVASFNNLLNADTITYKYAFLYDPNLYLPHDMFCSTSGKLNNYGMRHFVKQLLQIVTHMQIGYQGVYQGVPT